MLLKKTGITHRLLCILFKIHYKYNPEILEVRYFNEFNLIVEYLCLRLEHPKKGRKKILKLFTESAKNGGTLKNTNLINEYCYRKPQQTP